MKSNHNEILQTQIQLNEYESISVHGNLEILKWSEPLRIKKKKRNQDEFNS